MRRSSSIFQIIFDIVGWVMRRSPPPKVSSQAEDHQLVEKTSGDDETASPCNKLVPSTSSILYLSPKGAVPAPQLKVRKRSSPPRLPSTAPSTSLIASPFQQFQQYKWLKDQRILLR
ncbi:hypothetical protein REPUB_Repub13aG0029500 [Reevesia pubescens]